MSTLIRRGIWHHFGVFLYNIIFIPLLYVAYLIYALFNSKACDGLNGRKDIFSKIQTTADWNNR